MKKHIISVLISMSVVTTLLAGCGKEDVVDEPVVEEQVAEVVEQVVEEEPVEVVDEEPVEVIEEQVEETEEPVEETEEQTEELLPITEYAWDAYRMTDPSELEVIPVKGESYNINKYAETPSQLVHNVSEEKFQLDDFIWVNETGTDIINCITDGFYAYKGSTVCYANTPEDNTPERHYYLAGMDVNEYTGMDVFKTYCDKWGFCDSYQYEDDFFSAHWIISNDNPIFDGLPIDFSQNAGEIEHIGASVTINVLSQDFPNYSAPWEIVVDFIGEKTID